jgi:hypothetical protein
VGARRVHRRDLSAGDAGAREIHQVETLAGHDHAEVGDIAVRHRDLRAAHAAAVGARCDIPGRRHARTLGQREAADGFALGDARQPALLLGFGAC